MQVELNRVGVELHRLHPMLDTPLGGVGAEWEVFYFILAIFPDRGRTITCEWINKSNMNNVPILLPKSLGVWMNLENYLCHNFVPSSVCSFSILYIIEVKLSFSYTIHFTDNNCSS